MDLAQLNLQLKFLEEFEKHPIFLEFEKELKDGIDACTNIITQATPDDVESFFSREQAIGALSQAKTMLQWTKNYRNEIQSHIEQIS